MAICADGIIAFARRYAEALDALAIAAETEERRRELQAMAAICRRVPADAPRTFWEALQYYWFVHVGVITELNPWDAFNPGRLDQHLYPFYQADLAAGRLTREQARELLRPSGSSSTTTRRRPRSASPRRRATPTRTLPSSTSAG